MNRPALLLCLPLLLACGGDPAPASPPTAEAPAAPAAEAAAGPSDPFGYYFLDADKPQPAWAGEIDHLHLSTIDMKGEEMVTVPLWGFIRPKSGDDHRLKSPEQKGAHLTFTTEEVNGVSFAFDGAFRATGSFPETPPEGVVLAGKLRRLQGGQPAGEMDAEFLYTAGD